MENDIKIISETTVQSEIDALRQHDFSTFDINPLGSVLTTYDSQDFLSGESKYLNDINFVLADLSWRVRSENLSEGKLWMQIKDLIAKDKSGRLGFAFAYTLLNVCPALDDMYAETYKKEVDHALSLDIQKDLVKYLCDHVDHMTVTEQNQNMLLQDISGVGFTIGRSAENLYIYQKMKDEGGREKLENLSKNNSRIGSGLLGFNFVRELYNSLRGLNGRLSSKDMADDVDKFDEFELKVKGLVDMYDVFEIK
jgi:hypothetical protein